MSNIISLVPKGEKEEKPPTEASLEIIELLEELLVKAKAGEFRSLAGSYINEESQTGSFYYVEEPIRMLGALDIVKQYLINYQIEI